MEHAWAGVSACVWEKWESRGHAVSWEDISKLSIYRRGKNKSSLGRDWARKRTRWPPEVLSNL